jgi:hypothetical protein
MGGRFFYLAATDATTAMTTTEGDCETFFREESKRALTMLGKLNIL